MVKIMLAATALGLYPTNEFLSVKRSDIETVAKEKGYQVEIGEYTSEEDKYTVYYLTNDSDTIRVGYQNNNTLPGWVNYGETNE